MEHTSAALRWWWIASGVLLGAVLISLFLFALDPRLEQPAIAGLIVGLSIILTGILVGFGSRGETIREAGLAGLLLVVVCGILTKALLDTAIPVFAWLMAPFFVPALAMLGGWAGELLQGTLEEAYDDRAVDWPWVMVSIVIGFTLSSFAVLLGQRLLGLTTDQSLYAFAGSFLLTGWLVGFFSPGMTMVEPAIAGGLMLVVDCGFVILAFDRLPGARVTLMGFLGGMALALLGGWLGEVTQRRARPRRGAELPH